MRDLAYRREQAEKAKRKAKDITANHWYFSRVQITPARIGVTASTHGKPCSCYMCGNPRKWFGELTVQERRYANTYEA